MQEESGADLVLRRNNPKKRSLLGMFGKRVSRVEPDPNCLHTGSYHSEGELTPVMRRSRNKNHNNNNISSSSSADKSKAINRLSGNFTFCCSSGVANALSPIETNDVPIVRPNIRPRSHLKLELDTLENWNVLDVSGRKLSAVPPITGGGFNYKPLESESSNFSKGETVTHEINLQKPITESKSRFRNRYLPPLRQEYQLTGAKQRYQDQHSSTPDIAQSVLDEERRDLTQMDRKSVSFDTLPNPTDPTLEQPRPASADSLARQALMAAHVLHLIPTEKAKQRNFFQGQLGANPLLGPAELDRMLPSREIKIFVGTWNMNGQNPPSQLNDLVFPNRMEHVPDIIALGTQESTSERYEWEVLLQETLGPSHVLLHSTNLGTLHLAVFLRRDLIWFCSVPEDDSLSVRPGTAFRTKGAVAISFCIFGTSLLFITSHLTAHQQKVKERVQDVKRIIHALDLPRNLNVRHKSKDVTTNFDCVFFCGDLNFRLSEPRSNLLKWIETTQFPLPEHLPHGFLHTDQLTQALSDGAAFKGFREAKITFPPTYKYDPGTQNFDTSSKQRAPAYTDRILYKFRTPSVLRRSSTNPGITSLPVICLAYDSVNSIVSSDHKPVWALFKCQVRPGIDSVPLAAGLFNRDVYLEGMRRRLNNTTSGHSAVCTIQ